MLGQVHVRHIRTSGGRRPQAVMVAAIRVRIIVQRLQLRLRGQRQDRGPINAAASTAATAATSLLFLTHVMRRRREWRLTKRRIEVFERGVKAANYIANVRHTSAKAVATDAALGSSSGRPISIRIGSWRRGRHKASHLISPVGLLLLLLLLNSLLLLIMMMVVVETAVVVVERQLLSGRRHRLLLLALLCRRLVLDVAKHVADEHRAPKRGVGALTGRVKLVQTQAEHV